MFYHRKRTGWKNTLFMTLILRNYFIMNTNVNFLGLFGVSIDWIRKIYRSYFKLIKMILLKDVSV